jgi:hypothetical protein
VIRSWTLGPAQLVAGDPLLDDAGALGQLVEERADVHLSLSRVIAMTRSLSARARGRRRSAGAR